MRFRCSLSLALIALLTPLAACGSGGMSAPNDLEERADPTAKATVRFPPNGSLTDAAEVTVVGTASAGGGVEAVRVNGRLADTSDGYATWSTTVPLGPGLNRIQVDVEDAEGLVARGVADTEVRQSILVGLIKGLAVDEDRREAYLLHARDSSIVGADLDSGALRVISGRTRGSGPDLSSPGAITTDGDGRLFVTDLDPSGVRRNRVVVVDVATGDRTDATVGDRDLVGIQAHPASGSLYMLSRSGDVVRRLLVSNAGLVEHSEPRFANAVGFDQHPTEDRFIVVNGGGDLVELVEGAASVVNTEDYRSTVAASTVLYDGAGEAAFVLDRHSTTGARELQRVLLATGQALPIAEFPADDPEVLALAALGRGASGRAWAAAAGSRKLLVYDGDRQSFDAVNLPGLGSGMPLYPGPSLAFDPERRAVLSMAGLGRGEHALATVDVSRGDRSVDVDARLQGARQFDYDPLARRYVATGEDGLYAITASTGLPVLLRSFRLATGVSFLPGTESRYLVADAIDRALYEIKPDPIEIRRVITDATREGSLIGFPQLVVAAPDGERAYLFDSGFRVVIEVDLATGDQKLVSGSGVGSGPDFLAVSDMAIDPTGSVLFYTDGDVMAVDLSSGDRFIVSPSSEGTGHRGIAVDPETGCLLVTDAGLIGGDHFGGLLCIEPLSGDRVYVSR